MFRYLNNLIKQPHPARLLISYILWRTGLCRFFHIRYNGFLLQFHPSAFSSSLWANPNKICDDDKFFVAYLRPGDVVVDVGANIGTLSLCASRIVGNTGKTYSIEAHPRTFSYLQKNLALNAIKNIVSLNMAAGNANGTLCFSDQILDDQNYVLRNGNGMTVPVHALDVILQSEKHIRLLKVDVEGYEKYVLEGASETLSYTEAVYFEAWDTHFDRFDYSFSDVWRILTDQGFYIFRFPTNTSMARVSIDYHPLHCENLVAVRNVDEFLQRTNFILNDNIVSESHHRLIHL
jgi:FkbM family methyltransferase